MANIYGFEEYKQGLEIVDIKTGYKWRLEKRWTFKGREAMWDCVAVDKKLNQQDTKIWFVGDIAESLGKSERL
jgi:hypothetical protein